MSEHGDAIGASAVEQLADKLFVALAARLDRQVLDVQAVKERYRLSDARAARAAMRQAGSFHLGGRLFVHLDRLLAWERSRVEASASTPSVTLRPRRARREEPPALAPDFWREA